MGCTTSLVLFHFLDAKGKLYKTFVRLETMHRSEQRALNKMEKLKTKITKTRNVKVVSLGANRIENEYIRGSFKSNER